MKLNTPKYPQKQGRILEGGGKNFSGWPEYIPLQLYLLKKDLVERHSDHSDTAIDNLVESEGGRSIAYHDAPEKKTKGGMRTVPLKSTRTWHVNFSSVFSNVLTITFIWFH